MKKKGWLKLGLFLLMIGSLGMFLYQKNQSIQGEEDYKNA